MIVDNGKYYLYRHIRKDTGDPFYIGIGRKWPEKKHEKKIYFRAHQVDSRSDFWYSVVSKSDFDVEILLESDDRDFIHKKEREFITLYGRSDIHTGILVNMTDGGNGPKKSSDAAKLKVTETRKRTGMFSRNQALLKKMREEGTIKYYSCNCYIYSSVTGDFEKKFDSQKECAEYAGLSEHIIGKCLKNKQSFKQFIFTHEWLGDTIDISLYTQKRRMKFRVFKINPESKNVVSSYGSILEAAKEHNVSNSAISKAVSKNIKSCGFFWAIEDLRIGVPLIKSEKICKKFIPVFCYINNSSEPVMSFISSTKAGKYFGCTGANIRRAVKTNAKAAGYYWANDTKIIV